jgi:hypothetical protein
VSIDNRKLTSSEQKGETPIVLTRGSYLVNASYEPDQVLKALNFEQKSEETKEIRIGRLPQGRFSVNFQVSPGQSGKIVVAISQGRVTNDLLKSIGSTEVAGNNFIFLDSIDKSSDNLINYSKLFGVDLETSQEYYLYFFYLGSQDNNPLKISNVAIQSDIGNGDIQFACVTKTNTVGTTIQPISIEKISPVRYILTIPKNFKGFLAFNQAYDGNWIAHEENSSKILPHLASGYANAWFIEKPVNGKIIVEYEQQTLIERNAIISVVVLAIFISIYWYVKKRDERY